MPTGFSRPKKSGFGGCTLFLNEISGPGPGICTFGLINSPSFGLIPPILELINTPFPLRQITLKKYAYYS